jgi:hypothetical protein
MGRPLRGPTPRQTLTVRLAPELIAEVRDYADSVTFAVEQGLALWLAREKKRRAAGAARKKARPARIRTAPRLLVA